MAIKLIDEIYEAVLPEMKVKGIEDTPENRLNFLTGLRKGWMEDDEDHSMTKAFYLMALNNEIFRLKFKVNALRHE